MIRRTAWAAGLVWLALSAVLWAIGARPAVPVLAGLVAVVAAGIAVVRDLGGRVVPLTWTTRPDRHRTTSSADRRVATLHTQLERDRRFGSTDLRDTLVALVDDRLLAHRSIDRATDPAAALDALTPALAELVSGPARPVTSLRELHRIVTDIEAL